MGSPVRFGAREPGAANVLGSVLLANPRPLVGDWEVWAQPGAEAVFTRAGIDSKRFDEHCTEEELEAAWEANPASALITGANIYNSFETNLWSIAKRYGCPSLAVIDHWMNIESRFALGRPDYVGAIDNEQVMALEWLGFEANQIIIIGHPWLELLRKQHIMQVPPRTKPRTRSAVNVMFISEPISYSIKNGYREPVGFDEFDSFELVHSAAELSARRGINVLITVKFHPYEDHELFKSRAEKLTRPDGVEVRYVEGKHEALPFVVDSDLVTGISSMLLLEAMMMGKPVVTVQPGLVGDDLFIASARGAALRLDDSDSGLETLSSLICDKKARESEAQLNRKFLAQIPPNLGGAIQRWIQDKVPLK